MGRSKDARLRTKNKQRNAAKKRRSKSFEPLEKRELLAGDLVESLSLNINVSGGDLSAAPTTAQEDFRFQTPLQHLSLDKKSLKASHPTARPGGADTFDFSSVGQTLEIAIKKSDIIAQAGSTTLVTAQGDYRPASILGTAQDDLFSVEKSGKIAGTIDAAAGSADFLTYSGNSAYAGKVRVNLGAAKTERNPQSNKNQTLSAQSGSGVNNTSDNGIAGFEIVTGGKKADVLYGFADTANRLAGAAGSDFIVGGSQADVIVGGGGKDAGFVAALRNVSVASPSAAHITTLEQTSSSLFTSDKDVLVGKGGADLLVGGPSNDHLYGGTGNDRLLGGAGDDSFHFEDDWGIDQLSDASWEDKLDFSQVNAALKISLSTAGYTVMAGADRITDVPAFSLAGTTAVQQHALSISGIPAARTTLGTADNLTSTYALDLTQADVDLVIAIEEIRNTTATKVTITSSSVSNGRITIFGVTEIIGGRGNNHYKLVDGVQLSGTLTGGPSDQAVGKTNTLDYTKYGESVLVNATSETRQFNGNLIIRAVDPSIAALPKQEVWTLTTPGTTGAFVFEKDGQPIQPTGGDAEDLAVELSTPEALDDGADVQRFKAAFAAVINRAGFSVSKQVSGADTEWTIKFSQPRDVEALQDVTIRVGESPKAAVAAVTSSTRTIAVEEGTSARNETYDIATDSESTAFNENKFRLQVKFLDLNGNTVGSTTDELSVDATPRDIQQKLQATVNLAAQTAELDVAPAIWVTGRGTSEFPWRVEFANLGALVELTGVSVEANASDSPIPSFSATGVRNLTQDSILRIDEVIGSGNEDRIYGTAEQDVTEFDVAAINAANNEIILNQRLDLRNGESVVYAPVATVPDGPQPVIVGLVSGQTYLVKTTDLAAGSIVRFFANAADLASDTEIAITAPAGTTTHSITLTPDLIHAIELAPTAVNDYWLPLGPTTTFETGQAVLYRTVEVNAVPRNSVIGLVNESIYFVKVERPETGDAKARFYRSKSDLDSILPKHIRITAPSTTSHHQLIATPLSDGGKGDDFLIGPIDNDESAQFGGKGDDSLVGSKGADYLDGGKGDDLLFGDGTHGEADNQDDKNTLIGGSGKDQLFGYTGADLLQGGSGDDYLVGGSGSDQVEGGGGADTIAIIEAGNVDDYDKLVGGGGGDTYFFGGQWGTAQISEDGGLLPGSDDVIDLSTSSDNYVHILSDNSLFSVPGSYNQNEILVAVPAIDQAAPTEQRIKLGTQLESLTGNKRSPGSIVNQHGLGFFQEGQRALNPLNKNAILTAAEAPQPADDGSFATLEYQMRINRGDGQAIYIFEIPGGTYTTSQLKGVFENQIRIGANVTDLASIGLEVEVYSPLIGGDRLRLTATTNGSLDKLGLVIPAQLELTVKASNTVVAGDDFANIEKLKPSVGGNTFLFGNEYWGGGSSALTVAQALPIGDVIGRNLQGKLEIDTEQMHTDQLPLVVDFRASNYELYYTFSPIEGNADAVKLTVRTVSDLELPVVGLGPNIRNRTVVFSHVDKNTVLYGGRFKNTFNIDKGAEFQGHLHGGEGLGVVSQLAGRTIDHVRETLGVIESNAFGLSASDLSEFVFQVENDISYSNPNPLRLTANDYTTVVNLETLRRGGTEPTKAELAYQLAIGNVAPFIFDTQPRLTKTTGLSKSTDNTQDASLGDVIVRSGINFVRGTDYDPQDLLDVAGNPTAVVTSGADTIKIGDNAFSATPGFHLLAGGSGSDTYEFNSQFWGAALVVDDAFNVNFSLGDSNLLGDSIADSFLPSDTLDFSSVYQDLYYTVFEASLDDIDKIGALVSDVGFNPIPIDLGVNVTLVTPFDIRDPSLGQNFDLTSLFARNIDIPNFALAIGVENITGGRGQNTVVFYDGADLGGKVEPGFGGSLTLDYKEYGEEITVDLASSGIDLELFPQSFLTDIDLPDNVQSLLPNVTYQFGSATGVGNGHLGVAVGGNVTGSSSDDVITGNINGNVFDGGAGNDTLSGADNSAGDPGDSDTLIGGAGDDILNGRAGEDTLDGGADNDTLDGGTHDDTLIGGGGSDIVDGGDGADTYQVVSTADLFLRKSTSTVLPTHTDMLAVGFETDTLTSIETISISVSCNLAVDRKFLTADGCPVI